LVKYPVVLSLLVVRDQVVAVPNIWDTPNTSPISIPYMVATLLLDIVLSVWVLLQQRILRLTWCVQY